MAEGLTLPALTVFDARLVALDENRYDATFDAGGVRYTRRLTWSSVCEPGVIGALRLGSGDSHADFSVYPDQRLRRTPDRDRPALGWWSWAIEDHHFYVRAGIIPGIAGAVVRDECQPLEIQIPPEFAALCQRVDLTAPELLRAFIADVSAIRDSRRCPREDRYCSKGVDQRFLAGQYV
jgi:hypothetical protein